MLDVPGPRESQRLPNAVAVGSALKNTARVNADCRKSICRRRRAALEGDDVGVVRLQSSQPQISSVAIAATANEISVSRISPTQHDPQEERDRDEIPQPALACADRSVCPTCRWFRPRR
jgi:hypothetical protein